MPVVTFGNQDVILVLCYCPMGKKRHPTKWHKTFRVTQTQPLRLITSSKDWNIDSFCFGTLTSTNTLSHSWMNQASLVLGIRMPPIACTEWGNVLHTTIHSHTHCPWWGSHKQKSMDRSLSALIHLPLFFYYNSINPFITTFCLTCLRQSPSDRHTKETKQV